MMPRSPISANENPGGKIAAQPSSPKLEQTSSGEFVVIKMSVYKKDLHAPNEIEKLSSVHS